MEFYIVIFNPNYWIFNLGIAFNRYQESDGKTQWIRREIDLGLLLLSLRLDWRINETAVD